MILDPRLILIIVAISGTLWLGEAAVAGVKEVARKVQHVAEKVLHLHQHAESADRPDRPDTHE